jgi:hypothetical protein
MVHFAYMPSPIPRQVRWKFVRSYIPSTSAFPETGAGRLLHHYFGACSAFTYVTACMLARSPSRPSAPEASAVTLPPLLL